MKNQLAAVYLCLVALGGCGGGEEQAADLSFVSFSQQYLLSDFNLNADYGYWEIRRGMVFGVDFNGFDVISRFDEKSYANLSSEQAMQIANATSQTGFSKQCLPLQCPIYGVALQGNRVTVLDSTAALKEFFGEVDTEAELFILLEYAQTYAESTHPEKFEPIEDGYLVELSWDTLCQLRGKDLVKVGRDGKIEKIREIARETYQACV